MTEPGSPDSPQATKIADPQSDATAEPELPAPEPEPEPWTPARVTEWNAYYDLYVVLGVLLLVFVASANKISHTAIWSQLQAGRIMIAKAMPLTTDPFSYTEPDRRWVNIPWLFEWGHALLERAARGMVRTDPAEPSASVPRADQVGAGALVALDALVRVATVLLVLAIRRPGPGLWWAAVCAALAMGAIVNPAGVMLGGIAGPGSVSPDTWGQLLLAVELLLLDRWVNLGRRGAGWALIPLFLLWANVDESFLFGLIVLAAMLVGRLRPERGREGAASSLTFGGGLPVLVGSALVCLANPSLHRAYLAALEPISRLFQPAGEIVTVDTLSFFGKSVPQGGLGVGDPRLQAYYVAMVTLGIGSFVLNRRHFSLGRFLVFAVATAAWGAMLRFSGEFALVFAATLILNGQEWYHDRFGTSGRLGRGWAVWSIGGRAVTIILVFVCVAMGLTGWGRDASEPQFGFGFNPDDFAFEAADFLKSAPIRGNILNTTTGQGDALIWRAYEERNQRRVFIDSRRHLYPRALQNELKEIQIAIRDDRADIWKPALDRFKVSAIMIEQARARKTYPLLMQSPNWVPFYDDGNIIMFGRSDAPAADLAFFQANRLDPETLAYHHAKSIPSAGVPPTATSVLDRFFRNRTMVRPQAHDESARRWLEGAGLGLGPDAPVLPDPARCLLAIREARIALSHRPDDNLAYRILSDAYRILMIQETALLGGLELTPANAERIGRVSPRADLLMNRFRQRITAMNYAIQTTPPPTTDAERQSLQRLNLDMSRLQMSVNFIDLGRDRLQAVLTGSQAEDMPADFRASLQRDLGQLDAQVRSVQEQMDELTADQQAGPLQRAAFAISRGAPGLAIQELEGALQINVAPGLVKPQLLDLYCDTGQPEKALELIGGNVDDPTLGTEPGVAALRQGLVYFLLGNYEYAATLWERNAIPNLRYARAFRVLAAAHAMQLGKIDQAPGIVPQAAQGGSIPFATTTLMTIPGTLATQANWEYDLAVSRLESGQSAMAADQFTMALTLAPNLNTRPIAAYYLGKLGKPVPPPRTTDKDKDKDKDKEKTEKAKEPEPAARPETSEARDEPKTEEKPRAEEKPKDK
jgi:tetratricopeptide (TPR) repeat protein